MKFSISILTALFHKFPASHALRTDKFRDLLVDKMIDYCAADSRDGKDVMRKFLVHDIDSSWIAESNGAAVLAAEVAALARAAQEHERPARASRGKVRVQAQRERRSLHRARQRRPSTSARATQWR